MKKFISIFVGVTLSLTLFVSSVSAQTTAASSTEQLIQSLQNQIVALQVQVDALTLQVQTLTAAKSKSKEHSEEEEEGEEAEGSGGTLKLSRYLHKGMTGEDIELLQELLATNPEVYPEAYMTGYFGPLTEKAVAKFQRMAGIEQVGVVGPKTLAKINEILAEGAGKSGKVPPGLLIAPGILKKLGFAPQPLPGQQLPPGIAKKFSPATTTATTTEDVVPPVISGLQATSTKATSTTITWLTDEESDSKAWYGIYTPLVIATTTTSMVSSADLVLNHNLLVSGLTASTTYYYLVSSADASGNTATSSEMSFTTLPE